MKFYYLLTIFLLITHYSIGQPKGNWTFKDFKMVYKKCIDLTEKNNPNTEKLCNCMKVKFSQNFSPQEYKKLSDSAIFHFFFYNNLDCVFRNRLDDQHEYSLLRDLSKYEDEKNYVAQEKVLKELVRCGYDSWDILNSLGFVQLCLKKYSLAKRTLDFALQEKPNDLYIQGNLANYYLLIGNYTEAIKIYIANKEKKMLEDKLFKEAVSEDLREFERLGIPNTHFGKVRAALHIDWETSFSNSTEKGQYKTIKIDKNLDTSAFSQLTYDEEYSIKRQEDKEEKNHVDLLNNRAKLMLQTQSEGEIIKQNAINEKLALCNCYYEGDTLFVQINIAGGGSWFGPYEGLGLDIKIIGNQFSSSFNRWSTMNKVYREQINDTNKHYILVDNEEQELHLRNKLTYKQNDLIYGLLKFRSKTYYIAEDESHHNKDKGHDSKKYDERFQGAMYFKCNKLKSRKLEWKRRKDDPPVYIKAPYHIFDIQEYK